MRAAMFIEALRAAYRVSLLVVPLFGDTTPSSVAFAREHCDAVYVSDAELDASLSGRLRHRFEDMPIMAQVMADQAKTAASLLAGQSFEVIHAFRLYAAPLAIALARRMRPAPRLHLDLDDVESSTHARLAGLHRLNRHPEDTEAEVEEAKRYRQLEGRLLPAFQRIYACSEPDAAGLRGYTSSEIRVVPNAVVAPDEPVQPLTTHPFTFLFLGTLGYFPNEDAAYYFCREVLPRIRARNREPFLLRVVGRGMADTMKPLAGIKGVRLIGEVADIGREYADADAVVVPIRAGGGTRIKVLEAFAYRRPVVATSIGVEGIDVVAGEHCLIGDTPGAFAKQCLRLMQDGELGKRLADNAYRLVSERYSPEAVRDAVIGST